MGVTAQPNDLDSAVASDGLLDLAREFVGRAVAERQVEGDGLLDIEINGIRCTLTRVHKPESLALSPREREIARLVAKGYPNKTIASVLEISTWTVSTHLRRIFAKLDVHTRAAMIACLVEDGRLRAPSDSSSSASRGPRWASSVDRTRRRAAPGNRAFKWTG